MQSDFHGLMTLLSNLEQSLVHWSFDYNAKFLQLFILSRPWEQVTPEGNETLISLCCGLDTLLCDICNAGGK